MKKPRIVIIDDDFSYIVPLQSKFIYEYFDDVDIEIITEESLIQEFFGTLQKIEILIVNKKYYHEDFLKHEIDHIFVMKENPDEELDCSEQVHILYKYTNVKGIFLEIVGISNLKIPMRNDKKDPKIIMVTSACGGTGKTTLALGIATALSDMYKRVLYIEASHMQTFSYFLKEPKPIASQGIYGKLTNAGKTIYEEVKHELRKEKFTYLPPFKATIMSFGITFDVFGKIAKSAKESGEYDYIIVDADNTFDDAKAKMMGVSDNIMIITEQTPKAVHATNILVSNINNIESDKYLFICNRYTNRDENAFSTSSVMNYNVDEYVQEFDEYHSMNCEDFAAQDSIRKVAFLLI